MCHIVPLNNVVIFKLFVDFHARMCVTDGDLAPSTIIIEVCICVI